MVTDKQLYLIPLGVFIISFLMEFLSGKVSFFTQKAASWIFWVGMAIAGLLILMDLFAFVYGFKDMEFLKRLKPKQSMEERLISAMKSLVQNNTEEQNGTNKPNGTDRTEEPRTREEKTSIGNPSSQE